MMMTSQISTNLSLTFTTSAWTEVHSMNGLLREGGIQSTKTESWTFTLGKEIEKNPLSKKDFKESD